MSHALRVEDLDMGVMFEVAALGTVSLGQTPSPIDLAALQKPLRELYLAYYKSTGVHPLPHCRLVISNKGLAVTETPSDSNGRLPGAETLYNIPSVSYAAAVKFILTGKKDKDLKCAFEAIDAEPPSTPKSKNDIFVSLDKKWRHLSKVSSHPAICACVIQRMTGGVKASELHAFVCDSDAQARDAIFGLTSASRNFAQREINSPGPTSPIYGQGVYDYARPGPAPNGGPDHPQQFRPTGEGVYGIHGRQEPIQQMAYRGHDVNQLGAIRPEIIKPSIGWMQDTKAPSGARPIQGDLEGPQSAGWLSQQRDQLMTNFQEDQRKIIAAEQGVYSDFQKPVPYDSSRGVYDMQMSKGVYDMQPPKAVYDSQASKGVYDQQSAIYEYRPPQPQMEPSRNYASSQGLEGGYEPQRGLFQEPASLGARGRAASSERLFDEQMTKGSYEVGRKISEPLRDGRLDREPEGGGAKGFAIPRSKVSYDSSPSDPLPSGPLMGVGYEPAGGGRSPQPPPSPQLSSRQEQTVDRKTKKAQPPPPKPRQPSATSPTTESAPRPGLSYGSHPQENVYASAPADKPSSTVAPKKVGGIKVFPTILLRGAQAQAAASAAAAAADDDEKRRHSGDNQPAVRTRSSTNPINDPNLVAEKSMKDMEIETAIGGLRIEPGSENRKSTQDFEHSLGYFP